MRCLVFYILSCLWGGCFSEAAPVDEGGRNSAPDIVVFVALCDNEHQGIVPVPARIGDGNDPDNNLYWGCSDGLPKVFGRSKSWKREKDKEPKAVLPVLRTVYYTHASGATLLAYAYRGDSMPQCLAAFQRAVVSGDHRVVVFIGHNGLMDSIVEEPSSPQGSKSADTIILCCQSDAYFFKRLEKMKSRPLLLTRQNMYPGAFILHDALEVYFKGGSRSQIRQAAGKAYGSNQKISTKAGIGIFANLDQ